jgi:Family of unknown function (DUF5946)
MKSAAEKTHSVCCGCGAAFPNGEGPVHRYMTASPACWSAYGVVLTREYSDRAHAKFHRLSVDAYAVQHPGSASPEAIQSVAVHLCRLGMIFEDGYSVERANDAMLAIHQGEHQFRWLEPPRSRGRVTVAEVLAAQSVDEHLRCVERWARSCWEAWSRHHATIRQWRPTAARASLKISHRRAR